MEQKLYFVIKHIILLQKEVKKNIALFTSRNFVEFGGANTSYTSFPISIDVGFMINYLYACNTRLLKVP